MTDKEELMLADSLDYLDYVVYQVKERLPLCGLTDKELKSEVYWTFRELLRWYRPQAKDERTPQSFRIYCRQFGARRTVNRLIRQIEKERRRRDLTERIRERIEADEQNGIVRHQYGFWDIPKVESAVARLERRDFWHHVLDVCDVIDLRILRMMLDYFVRNGNGKRKSCYCDYAKIGRCLGMSGNAVKKRMKRLAERLRHRIGDDEFADCCAA